MKDANHCDCTVEGAQSLTLELWDYVIKSLGHGYIFAVLCVVLCS